jgi:hypothetical protein
VVGFICLSLSDCDMVETTGRRAWTSLPAWGLRYPAGVGSASTMSIRTVRANHLFIVTSLQSPALVRRRFVLEKVLREDSYLGPSPVTPI